MDPLYLLALLACPVGMGAMMWLMMRGKGHSGSDHSGKTQQPQDVEIAQLRAEVDQLRTAAQLSPDSGRREGDRT